MNERRMELLVTVIAYDATPQQAIDALKSHPDTFLTEGGNGEVEIVDVQLSPSPLDRYDRQAHLSWYDRQYPDRTEWPPEPRTDEEAARYIAEYTGQHRD